MSNGLKPLLSCLSCENLLPYCFLRKGYIHKWILAFVFQLEVGNYVQKLTVVLHVNNNLFIYLYRNRTWKDMDKNSQ